MPYEHEGYWSPIHTFNEVWEYLESHGELSGETMQNRSPFIASAKIASRSGSGPERVIRFRNPEKSYRETARAYECCWGSQINCNRTRIGMYCAALHRVYISD